ncbi:uncharacterized protein LOC110038950 [Phalaenopsis equestris]|uniref:uncharacterized protein LOC110038950 n=1 Tax=Phalaenopsis equestris TaxID=78828 RepID=UPI0009E4CE79|nr:uncharacterized protein LOC110038950 [Phalaenopsis equestris]
MGTNVNLSGKEDGNHGGSSSQQGGGGGAGGDTASSGVRTSNGAAATATAAAASSQALKHDPGLTVYWTAEEQGTLEDMLSKYASDPPVVRYAKVAKLLPEKTVRDVALRSRWMTKKESGKRRKDDSLSRKTKDKKERATDSTAKPSPNLVARPNIPPYAMPMMSMENDDEISCKAIGGPTGQLLDQTAQIFSQISGNFNHFQINDNLTLFCQARDNILKIMNELDDVPGIMSQMPPLPVRLNEELANTILPMPPPA